MKIALIYADDFSLWHFHRDLLARLRDAGHDVYAVSPSGKYVKHIEAMGVRHIPVRIHRFMSPIRDILLAWELYRMCRQAGFDVVHNFTIKPNIYGAVAARLAGVGRVIGTAEGLGYMYGDGAGWKVRLMRPVVNAMYRIGCSMSHRFWFVNPDDRDLFVAKGILAPEKAFLTISAGVNVQDYSADMVDESRRYHLREKWNLVAGETVILMVVARVIWTKGVREFVEAAELLAETHPSLRFLLVGPVEEDSPESVPEQYLREKERTPSFRWWGFTEDIKAAYSIADLVVLPSYYREGVPNVLLEAMALGRAIITTDHVGCKEVVEDGKNGLLVPVRDARALAEAVETLVLDEGRRRRFGEYARVKAERDFDKRKIINRIMRELYEVGEPDSDRGSARDIG